MIRFPASEALAENCRDGLWLKADVRVDVSGDSNVDVDVMAVVGGEEREVRREENGRRDVVVRL